MNYEVLKNAGIDGKRALTQFLNDRELYELMLRHFLKDTTLARAQKAWDEGNRAALFACAHKLKNICAHLAIAEPARAACALEGHLRYRDSSKEVIERSFRALKEAYARAVSDIRRAMTE